MMHCSSIREMQFLIATFTKEEVNFFEMKHNKAPGPDGFSAEFYQTFWDIIKVDMLELFSDLHKGQLERF